MSETPLKTHEKFMNRALELAGKAWGKTHPNPMVGAVLVEEDEIIAEGYHRTSGEPHAEIEVLQKVLHPVSEDTVLYVTLEPCSTEGRTGACTEAIKSAGLKKVVIGAMDPNPEHNGRGIEILREAGIEVITGICEEDCQDLNMIFNHWISRQTPLIAGKVAISLDGKIATRNNLSRWITGGEARKDVMRWRRLFPAIAVGVDTLLQDDPILTSRCEEEEWCPWRMVMDGMLRSVRSSRRPKLFEDEYRDRTIIVTTESAGMGYVRQLENQGLRVWCLPGPQTRIGVHALRERCRVEGIEGIYLEGGPTLLSGFMEERGVDYMFVYQAPVFFADRKARSVYRGLRTESLEDILRLRNLRRQSFDQDALVRGYLEYPERMQIDEALFGNRE
ncbi:MAG: bifunctional diaminohydroxyphosphoribosylaminopyrimidine deaminase/5-amino-6-(5-phosphoribosylamino)uracil reductase RibD [Opitutales bacterium]|nr:bifunctional diaminohydroxyphosphoribosylaminopyrimidine deaminase/5-amino-6-(5-phosphoribosylamino)uracil reductase RibD [Opitutales bacterium]MCH8540322.1 bifunctional diaminohydroxyphosphoribosylaminopyrimidine deaminase/5-amino-6-(5-phosphoribosylamino)uracil reductase RibD [Opitutales bacterium]